MFHSNVQQVLLLLCSLKSTRSYRSRSDQQLQLASNSGPSPYRPMIQQQAHELCDRIAILPGTIVVLLVRQKP